MRVRPPVCLPRYSTVVCMCFCVECVLWGGIRPLNGCLQTRCLLIFLYVCVSVNLILNWEVAAECCSGTQNCSVLILRCELMIFVYLLIIELLFEFACLIS